LIEEEVGFAVFDVEELEHWLVLTVNMRELDEEETVVEELVALELVEEAVTTACLYALSLIPPPQISFAKL
jgi:hypothetical protein